MIGESISHYTILEKLGEGGMGVVYRAHDTVLDRVVALKFLPQHLTANEAEKARFLQEAKAAATLNHPNICIIHGIQEHEGQQFIEMEYVDGRTLRELISGGSEGSSFLRIDQSIGFAIQIGEALQEAHSKGIVHRDVKAENIMVNSKNQIKVMDFGLAKLKGSLKLTRTSSTVGTLSYMAPEQLRGGEVDARSDIFSFGVVLYEMVTGRTPFRGEHEAALMYSILNEEIEPVQKYRPEISGDLTHVLETALEKDPEDRYQSVSEMVRDLRRLQKKSASVSRKSLNQVILPGGPGMAPPTPAPQASSAVLTGEQIPASAVLARQGGWLTKSRSPALLAGGGIVVVVLLYWAFNYFRTPNSEPAPEATFRQLTDQPGEELYPDISPDGNFIAYTKVVASKSHIFLQRIAGGNPIDLTPGSREDNSRAVFSPNGELLAFRSEREGGGLYIMGATGESVRRLTDFGFDPAWSPDGKEIICATQEIITPFDRPGSSELWTVNVASGEKRAVSTGDAAQPQWSPHGSRIAYWGLPAGTGRRVIFTMPSTGGSPSTLIDDGHINWDPVWSPDGRYLYFSSNRGGSLNLWRVSIDEESGKMLGTPEPITTPSAMSGFLKVSHDGHRVIYTSLDRRANVFRVAFDPVREIVTGSPVAVTEGSRECIDADLSADGEWLVFRTAEAQEDLFVVRNDGADQRQLTNDSFKDRGPAWSPDGKRIAFYSDRSGQYELWSINADGSGLQQLSHSDKVTPWYPRWYPDGTRLACGSPVGAFLLDLSKPFPERTLEPFPPMQNPNESFQPASISRDGLRLAGHRASRSALISGIVLYSMESRSYKVLSDSGANPVWLKDDRRLMFDRNGRLCIMDEDSRNMREVKFSTANLKPSGLSANYTSLGFRLSRDNKTLYFIKESREADIWEATFR